MKLQKIKQFIAGIVISSMIASASVYAADTGNMQFGTGVAQSETEREASVASAQQGGETSAQPEDDVVAETEGEAPAKEELTARGETEAEELRSGSVSEEETLSGEMSEDESIMDERSQALYEEYEDWLSRQIDAQAVGTYADELAKFPASYRTYLEKLHKSHPNWIFVAVKSKLKWNDIVKAESVSGSSKGTNQSLLPNSSYGLLLSKASTDYSTSKGKYIAKDGSTWVSASKPAVAYYVDPRNFLNDNYIFMFEALEYNASYHKLSGVENILKNTDLANKQISYINTAGKTISTEMTYGQAIYAAGGKSKVSPLFLAAKIRQETGAKLTNGSISGKYSYGGKSYRGYYNFYNIGAYSSSQGSAIANGLYYAKGGSGNAKTYSRPWTSPMLAIQGGADFLAASYITRGQNTIYYQRFNTKVAPYYQHQYMQNLTAAASEAKTTYNAYSNMKILDDAYVFYIPVYTDMPSQDLTVSIKKSVNTGKIISDVNLRKGTSSSTALVTTIPKGKTVTVSGAVYTDASASVSNQEKSPYWYKVTYGSKSGYVSARYVDMNTDSTIKPGGTKQLSVTSSGSGEKIYYETSDPAVATVSASGKVTGVKSGNCDIYAVTSSGKMMDAIGISVSGTAAKKLSAPKLVSASNTKSGVEIKWKKVSGAKGYYIYRKVPGGSWKNIKKITSGSTVKYTDKTMSAGKKYVYTVKAYAGSTKSGYDKTGLTIRRLRTPELVSAKSTSKGIKVSWKKVKSSVTYEVFRKKKGGSYSKIAEVKAKNLSYTDTSAKKGTTYYYTVKARSGIYRSSYNSSGKKGIRK